MEKESYLEKLEYKIYSVFSFRYSKWKKKKNWKVVWNMQTSDPKFIHI